MKPTVGGDYIVNGLKIGTFLSAPDEDGYCKILFDHGNTYNIKTIDILCKICGAPSHKEITSKDGDRASLCEGCYSLVFK
jgi:hypothetical protein